ncbi:MAG: S1 RNA-binding domain-containing protein [Lachnospiraceae bacterium]|nr:S1 RNA-binding domain-containing protein [Lachnospiraceae bacterium]
MANETMADFEKELTSSFRVMKAGELVKGMIVDINDELVTLDLGYYAPGVIPLSELSDDPDFSAMKDLKIGDTIEAVVIDTDDGKGNVELSLKEVTQGAAWEKLKEMLELETVTTVRVKESVNAGVVAYLEGIRAFIPASQLALAFVENTEEYIGKQLEVKVITVDERAKKLVLSAKAVLKEREAEHDRQKMAMIVPGSIFEGTVESLMPYGAFVQMDNGLSGLVHISKICMKRIKKPSEVLSVGQQVKVKVLEVKDGKISLSIRDVETNTSEIVTDVIEKFDYQCEETPNNPFGALLAGIKLDD